MSADDQQVTFSLSDNSNRFCISVVYASTNYIHRRQLWQSLESHQNQTIPWCSIGDFNSILGSHEHRGAFPPARGPMNDFSDWSDNNNLFHLPTRGVQLTWSNGRGGSRHTERRLDRVICNQQWLDMCNSLNVTTLTKLKSDHFPILLHFENSQTTFKSQFKFLNMCTLHENCKHVIQDSWNTNVIGCPMFILNQKLKILKQNLKIWNKNVFSNVHMLVKNAKQKLDDIQNEIE